MIEPHAHTSASVLCLYEQRFNFAYIAASRLFYQHVTTPGYRGTGNFRKHVVGGSDDYNLAIDAIEHVTPVTVGSAAFDRSRDRMRLRPIKICACNEFGARQRRRPPATNQTASDNRCVE